MLPLTIFLDKLIGLYCIIVALAMKQARRCVSHQALCRLRCCALLFADTGRAGARLIEHTRQSASIKSCLSCTGGDIARQRADVVLDQPCRQARRQRFDEHAPHRCLTLKFGRDCIGHLGDEWVVKASFKAQRRDRGRIGSFAQALRRELAWRKIDMQYCRQRIGHLNHTVRAPRRRKPDGSPLALWRHQPMMRGKRAPTSASTVTENGLPWPFIDGQGRAVFTIAA